MVFAKVGNVVSSIAGTVAGTVGAVAFGAAATSIGLGMCATGCGFLVAQKTYDIFSTPKQGSTVKRTDDTHSQYTPADKSVASITNVTAYIDNSSIDDHHQASLALDLIKPSNRVSLSEHECNWLKPYYSELIEFWGRHTIPPTSLKAPMYRQKLALVKQQGLVDKWDLCSLAFAIFVCEKKQLPYSGMACVHVLHTEEWKKLAPPS